MPSQTHPFPWRIYIGDLIDNNDTIPLCLDSKEVMKLSALKKANLYPWQSVPFRIHFVMYKIKETVYFSKWLQKLKDIQGKVSILRRIKRVKEGNFGDYKSLGDNIYELRITVGAGYRVYYTQKGDEIIILLLGGDKSTQTKDIAKAKKLAKEYQDE